MSVRARAHAHAVAFGSRIHSGSARRQRGAHDMASRLLRRGHHACSFAMCEGGPSMPRYPRWITALVFLMLPALAAAQNATVQGAVVDESKASMPGATITVTELA